VRRDKRPNAESGARDGLYYLAEVVKVMIADDVRGAALFRQFVGQFIEPLPDGALFLEQAAHRGLTAEEMHGITAVTTAIRAAIRDGNDRALDELLTYGVVMAAVWPSYLDAVNKVEEWNAANDEPSR
jgi:hypothetical protein